MAKKPPKFEALVVNAIRRLQAAQGSTETEIANYLNQEYNVQGPEVRKHIQLTLRRGMKYGILHKSRRGYVTCDRNIPDVLDVAECEHRRGSRGGRRGSRRRRRDGGNFKSSRHARSRSRGRRNVRRRRAANARGVRTRRMAAKASRARPRQRASRARTRKEQVEKKSRVKKTRSDSGERNANRQQPSKTADSRPSSKTPVRRKDDENASPES